LEDEQKDWLQGEMTPQPEANENFIMD
jgi:hypothetical protein